MNSNQWIRILPDLQTLHLITEDELVWQCPVSTARAGLGEAIGSFKTPRGMHRIAEKIGNEAPLNAIFKARQWTGEIFNGEKNENDLILTRILWLEGVEPFNHNTRERYIYIHGTNHEDKIGTPCSHGCIRLRNADMLELYERVEVGTPVEIISASPTAS
jgi:hypothetical protein